MIRVLITGANGCVGNALKSIRKDEDDWIFIDRSHCDLTNREKTIEIFKYLKPDYIIHLASYVPGFYNINRVSSFSNNVRINENVLEASNLAGIEKGMFLCSVNMFPENPSKFPMDESMMFEGLLEGIFSGYGYAKRMLALQCQNYNLQYNRKYFNLIPCNIYGPNDNMNSGRLIPNLINKFKEASKNDSCIMINGSGKPLRQFIYSIDLANIIKYLMMNYSDIKPIIACGDSEISIGELVLQIAKITQFDNNIQFDTTKPDGNFRKTMSNVYLKTIMPNVSFTSLESGLKEII